MGFGNEIDIYCIPGKFGGLAVYVITAEYIIYMYPVYVWRSWNCQI